MAGNYRDRIANGMSRHTPCRRNENAFSAPEHGPGMVRRKVGIESTTQRTRNAFILIVNLLCNLVRLCGYCLGDVLHEVRDFLRYAKPAE
jgi:hypothetical protein